MGRIERVEEYLRQHGKRFEEEFFDFLRIPSVSSDPKAGDAMDRCARWLLERFTELGLAAELLPTGGWPAIVAETPRREGVRTVLVYGHYDVQPVDPLDLWHSPPFEPRIENGFVYARGATDDKGQSYTHVKAAEAWIRATGNLPVNLIFLLEGEEEIGSPNLESCIRKHLERFRADAVLVSDTSQFGNDLPALCYALRGIAYMEFVVTGANQDLHSGMYGGIVPNPAQVVARVLAEMKTPEGVIAIPGFYDGIIEPADWEREAFQNLPWDLEKMAADLGLSELAGEPGYSVPERKWCRPTLDVNGLFGGYSGEGAKTVIPTRAGAKVSMRLVPGQSPDRIASLFESFVKERIPNACSVEVRSYQNSPAVLIPVDDPAMLAGKEAIARGFGKEPLMVREGASIPVVSFFVDEMHLPVVLLGFGLPDDNLHAPNERFTLKDFHRGILTSAHFMQAYARRKT